MMRIIKYKKTGNSNYIIEFDNMQKIKLNEDLIINKKILYKKEIDEEEVRELIRENKKYDIYNKCLRYIAVRVRSVKEIRDYLRRNEIEIDEEVRIIDKLLDVGLLNDEKFTKAFINDKLKFSSMGPYRIENELKKHQIEANIINKYMMMIDDSFLEKKITTQITKIIKSSKKKNNLRDKIYNNLVSLGYSKDMIIENLNKINF